MNRHLCIALVLVAASAAAQLKSMVMVHHLRVRITFASGGCDPVTRVTLMSHGLSLTESVLNEQCAVEFLNVPEDNYRVTVSSTNAANFDGGSIDASTGASDFEIKVDAPAGSRTAVTAGASPLVSISELNVPSGAKQDFEKANQLIQQQNFGAAIKKLNKAVAEYPSYASAYNNLGAVYGRLGDNERERESLQKAIAADDHFAPAYVNLGRLNIKTGDFAGAEAVLSKASNLDPKNAMTLVLLSYTEFMTHHYDEVIATCKKAHALSAEHAFAHQVAARAFEQKRDGASALAELNLFLKEEPSGPRADIARKELSALHAAFPALSAGVSQ